MLKIEELRHCAHFYQQTLSLIEQSFSYSSAEFHFDQDFALLLNKDQLQHSYVLIEEKGMERKVLGHIGVMLRCFTSDLPHQSPVKVALVGGVAIHPNYRGQGLFSYFWQQVEKKIKDEEVALIFLWSDQEELYKKFDFFPLIGQCLKLPPAPLFNDKMLEIPSFNSFTKTKFHLLSYQEKTDIKNLYQNHFQKKYFTLLRDENHWQQIEKITSSHLYIKREKNSAHIQSYFFKDKGQDLQNIIHEWAFRHEEEEKNFLAYLCQGSYGFITDERSGKEFNQHHHIGPMSLVKLVNPHQFKGLIEQWSNHQLLITDCHHHLITFSREGKRTEMSFSQLMKNIFGPFPQADYYPLGKPLFISGIDSI